MGSSYIGKELGKLNGIEDVQSLRNCNAFPLYDDMFDQSVDIGLIILTRNRFASNARNGMAWSHIAENE
ncbi:hypothetical protein [Desulfobacula sp.]|uniref:hypothetical protein n=1 Tax=Desulfobacula sp. TaxID=2593537 RepID=UPI0039B90B5D